MLRRFFGFSIISLSLLACSHDETASAHPRDGHSTDDGVAPRPAVIAPASQPYKVAAVTTPGTITGTVDLDGAAPAPEVVQPSTDQSVCGKSVVAKNVTVSGTRLADAVVWLTDIRTGKAFPLERRFDLTNNDCLLDPFVMAMTTNGTLNVGNDDRAVQTNRFINVGTGKVIAVAPFNDDGEVVPVDRFTEPSEVEVVSDQHPWAHAWIAVLDHPYFAQTDARGTFKIDGVPPGKYQLRAWHPSIGYADDSVTVPAGQQVSVALRIRPTAGNAPTVVAPATPTASSTPAIPILPTSSSTPSSDTVPPPSR
jgi:Polysaccharide lyase family 4, domain II